MQNNRYEKIINTFKNQHLAVIGDIMLDNFIYGDVERISPEAPVPVVKMEKELLVCGGAGNVAINISELKAQVSLLGVVGADLDGKQLKQILKKKHLKQDGVCTVRDRPTIKKTRIVARGQQIVRVDQEENKPLDKKITAQLLQQIKKNIANWNAIVISDYNKGVVTQELMAGLQKICQNKKIPLIGDTKPQQHDLFKNVTLIAPNKHEALLMSNKKTVKQAGLALQKKLHCAVLITQGADGMMLFSKNKITNFPVTQQEVYDVVGAGDTVVSSLALALGAGADLATATIIANHAAGVAVSKIGTATVSTAELITSLKNEK
ncbi:MAG: hypothetical protein A2233_03740 [Candidatus Kerfeldbacteria bacterium RIFOXYA2_FULL_38_24]|uniref:Carbohydrate kinase PfkB domain-containing protein n=1 Tax=Candidatus Kerfeldbacteria bacterium RIFOXYB2_FULL_38_14 TaxID=1798547 RepID=A0A1G2BAQ6_9BACT|nr:MAG: hypothetical protein A2233_03740 [Candidatus Kerfeldbacteria bacterium RIFOXYA2_FULL_38_24]OGY86095.1 MAG: hypothetical protein A2319_01385 [Candidatus Kerfeldbacteria bacterium RIFOXYB2_FULL_38_14]OGY89816.1 MAG: hypothetical protein A2458_05570 [Candidatus Kerfeldbacteria bacterium RIFOXYC2_FULL_38_9]